VAPLRVELAQAQIPSSTHEGEGRGERKLPPERVRVIRGAAGVEEKPHRRSEYATGNGKLSARQDSGLGLDACECIGFTQRANDQGLHGLKLGQRRGHACARVGRGVR
jgi:hypothetical protein